MIKFLIVEDNQDIRESIVASLFAHFKELICMEAHSGKYAEELILAHSPFDVIISDINMPDGDGYYLLDRVIVLNQNSYFIFFSNEVGLIHFKTHYPKFLGIVHKFELDEVIKRIKTALGY